MQTRLRLIVDVRHENKEVVFDPAITLTPSTLLSPVVHLFIHRRLSELGRHVASPFPN